MKDLFGRAEHNAFTFFDKRKKLIDWENDVEEGEALSTYILGKGDVAKNAPKILGGMLGVVGIDKRVETSLTAGRNKFQVPLNMIYDTETESYVQDMNKVDDFLGACIQQASLMKNLKAADFQDLMGVGGKKSTDTVYEVIKSCIYQEMGDKSVADNFPGYLKFVQKNKNTTFKDNWTGPKMGASQRARFLDLLVRMLRFPSSVEEEEMEEFEKYIREVENAMKSMDGFPSNQAEADRAIRSLYKIVTLIEDEEEPPSDGNDGDDPDGDGDDEGNGGGGGGGGSSKEEQTQELMQQLQNLLNMEQDNDGISEDVLESFDDEMKGNTPGDVKIDYSHLGFAEDLNVEFIKADSNSSMYNRDLNRIPVRKARVLQNLFTMKNDSHTFTLKSMKSGKFDTSKLVEARAGVPTVYERMGVVSTDQICIGVLVDESGSMSGRGPGSGSYSSKPTKIEMARQAAIYLNEVFGKLPNVDFFVYGHTEDDHDYSTIRVYREPGKKADHYAIGSMQARGCNRDGEAIFACAKRMRTLTDKKGIFLVISDGQPSGTEYSGQSAIEHTRLSVKKAEKLGFHVVQIAIDSRVPSEKMFTHFVKFNNIDDLPNDLVRFMSRKATQMMKQRVSF